MLIKLISDSYKIRNYLPQSLWYAFFKEETTVTSVGCATRIIRRMSCLAYAHQKKNIDFLIPHGCIHVYY